MIGRPIWDPPPRNNQRRELTLDSLSQVDTETEDDGDGDGDVDMDHTHDDQDDDQSLCQTAAGIISDVPPQATSTQTCIS